MEGNNERDERVGMARCPPTREPVRIRRGSLVGVQRAIPGDLRSPAGFASRARRFAAQEYSRAYVSTW
jgi:hypothetical protein